MELEGKVAIVTGGTRGIGRAIVLDLAANGADVALNYRQSADLAAELAETIRGMGPSASSGRGRRALAVQADVSSETLPLNEEFDIILAADVLFHVTDDLRFDKAITNMASLLKPDGHLILSDVFPKGVKTICLAEHVCHRPLSLYDNTLGTCALRRLHIEPIFVLLHPPLRGGGVSLFWDILALAWGYALRKMARWSLFDRFVPEWLYMLDKKLLTKRGNVNTPNLKWLVASQKRRAETL